MQAVIRRPAAEQLSIVQLREWQRYRGWSVKILERLENSGGETVRSISDATGGRCATIGRTLRRMREHNLVERVERWGWRITVTGVFLLSLSIQDTTRTQQGHNADTTQTQEKSEPIPPCFRLATCHIKQVCADKGYTKRNMALCHGTAACIWGVSGVDRVPVETKPGRVA